ncbi:hypothetical protein [Gynuella sunshinyii]|uniref:Tetratricopeptide repeat protein n=1 Tax=Gynuella sunshinyii YC6258 TaxID=1445510 RepID=A0A0C5VKR7_9GAMM|nr:hypothetical protein [Gynuella sunshinyii]AJQ94896.1 hypothetical Protein YC6258_02858 [Gynuella sunshinyii YC6258]
MSSIAALNIPESYFSRTLPEEVQTVLDGIRYAHPEVKEAALISALKRWPEVLDIHISLYKFYFRCGRYAEAEWGAWKALSMAARQAGISHNYRRLHVHSTDWSTANEPARQFLFSLKALGVIRLRRQKLADAQRVLTKLMELDPNDEVGGGSYFQIAEKLIAVLSEMDD